MGEMKSAWEIAMERAEKLGKASPEELKQQQEEKHNSIAQILAEKILSGLDLRHWETDLEKYPVGDRAPLKQKTLRFLAEAIDLEDDEKSRNSLTGIRYLRKEASSQAIEDQIRVLLDEYKEARESLKRELEKDSDDKLLKLGISSSAIAEINSLADSKGQQRLQELIPPYNEGLNKLKQELLA